MARISRSSSVEPERRIRPGVRNVNSSRFSSMKSRETRLCRQPLVELTGGVKTKWLHSNGKGRRLRGVGAGFVGRVLVWCIVVPQRKQSAQRMSPGGQTKRHCQYRQPQACARTETSLPEPYRHRQPFSPMRPDLCSDTDHPVSLDGASTRKGASQSNTALTAEKGGLLIMPAFSGPQKSSSSLLQCS